MTEQLIKICGQSIIAPLRIVLGTPNSINLRNIIWHGFPKLEDISESYEIFLVAIFDIIGQKLKEQNYKMKFRNLSMNMVQLFQKIEIDEKLSDFSFKKCEFISKGQLEIWNCAIRHYEQEEFHYAILLILPSFEHYLRRLYGNLYNIDIKAKIDEYYVILDTIFDENSIKIYNYFPEELLKLTYDIFTAPNGPRIRDKLSHGEIDLFEINDKEVCDKILILVQEMMKNEKIKYKSVFHPNCQFQNLLKITEKSLNNMKNLDVPENVTINWDIKPEIDFSFDGITELEAIKIFSRHQKREIEIVGILIRITENLNKTCDNLKESLEEKLENYKNKTLRTRARATYTNLLNALPKIHKILHLIFQVITRIFWKLQMDKMKDDQIDPLIR